MTFVTFKFNLEGFEELSSGLVFSGGRSGDECVNVSGGFEFEVEFVAFSCEKTEFAFKFITTFNVGNVTALEGG